MALKKAGRWHFLLSVGLLAMSGSTILKRTLPETPDFLLGLCTGVGIGLMLLALIVANKQLYQPHAPVADRQG